MVLNLLLYFSNPAFSGFQGMPFGWGEHTQVFLSLIFRKECGLSASSSKQREIKSVCWNIFVYSMSHNKEKYGASLRIAQNTGCAWMLHTSEVSKKYIFQRGKKHASRDHLTQINTEAVADLIAATGTNGKRAPFNSGGLLSPRIPGLTVPPAPRPVSEVSRKETQCQQKAFPSSC